MKPDELTRLSRLLGMVGSDHDGEALNAARLADRMVRSLNMTWEDVFSGTWPKTPKPEPAPEPPRHEPEVDEAMRDDDGLQFWPGSWRGAAEYVQRHGAAIISRWEMEEFLPTILAYSHRPSEKQRKILRRLLDEVTEQMGHRAW